MNAPLLRCRDLHCSRPLWREGESNVRGISADFAAGLFHAICGPEGCGKNLLLHLLGLLEQPDSGSVWFGGTETTELAASERDAMRQKDFGFLFPACALLPSLSVIENIAFTVLKAGAADEVQQADQTLRALQFCGLEQEADIAINELPPERQAAAAFARAIAHRPRVLIAETPAREDVLVPLARRAVDDFGLTVIWGVRPGSRAETAADNRLAMDGGRVTAPAA